MGAVAAAAWFRRPADSLLTEDKKEQALRFLLPLCLCRPLLISLIRLIRGS